MKTVVWQLAALIMFIAAFAAMRTETEPSFSTANAPRLEQIGEMSADRANHQAAPLEDGHILITGGCGGRGCATIHASAERYNPATWTFTPASPMATPRADHAAIALPDGRVLVAGGWTGREATASAEIYDPSTDSWTAVDEMSEARMSFSHAPLPDGRVLVMGGESETGTSLSSAEIFDPASSTFSSVEPMTTRRSAHVAILLEDGRVLVAGGHEDFETVLQSVEIYDPASGEFRLAGNMSAPRHKHAIARLPDGRVLIIGGSDSRDFQGRYASTETYDPRTGAFSDGPTMRWARYKIQDAVVTLPSGAVLVAGGADRPELLDPSDQVFLPIEGALSGSQQFATATLLPATEEVLVLGGYDDRIEPSAAAWTVSYER